MKILQISSATSFGGGERHLADLTNALAARGHEVYAALRPSSPLASHLSSLPASNLIRLPLRNALDVPGALALARLAREKEIQIIHAHMARDYTLAAFAALRSRDSRLVLTRHVLFPLGGINRRVLKRASALIAVSTAVAETLRPYAADDARVRVIPNGIDFAALDGSLAHFRRDEQRRTLAPEARFLVGTIGELSRVKGQEVFIRAAAQVARAIDGVEFLIVGEDASRTRETRARLAELIAQMNLTGRVRLMGRRDDVALLLSALDVFVSASRSEAFGLAIVEAMACATSVVATATEGAREIIDDGVTGKLVAVEDAAAMARTIISLLENERERARLGQNARRAARERFALARMVEETEAVYRAALEK